MKIGKIEVVWRGHRQAFEFKCGEVRKIVRITKKKSRKEIFEELRALVATAQHTEKVCEHCGKHYHGENQHKYLCSECADKAAKINREGVGHIAELSFSDALKSIPEGVDPVKFERELDAQIRVERQALVDLWKKDDQAWNLYCYGKRIEV